MELPLIVMFASLLATMGGGAQQTVGQLSDGLPNSPILPGLVVLTSALTAFAMAYSGAWLSEQTTGGIETALVAGALALAAITLIPGEPITPLREPTRSAGAIFLALLGKQIVDAPRWLVFAAGAFYSEPLGVALGASFGSAMALLLAWLAPDLTAQFRHWQHLRRIMSILTLAAGVAVLFIAYSA